LFEHQLLYVLKKEILKGNKKSNYCLIKKHFFIFVVRFFKLVMIFDKVMNNIKKPNIDTFKYAKKLLESSNIVSFPTETVY